MGYKVDMFSGLTIDVMFSIGAAALVVAFVLVVMVIWLTDLARRRRDVDRLSDLFGQVVARAAGEIATDDPPRSSSDSVSTNTLGNRANPR